MGGPTARGRDGFPGRHEGQGRASWSTSTATRCPHGIDKAADLVDEKTGGKLGDKVDLGADKAKDALDSLDGKNDDTRAERARPFRRRPGRPTSSCSERARPAPRCCCSCGRTPASWTAHWAAAAAGHVERGETALEAARREALEEIGVSGLDLELRDLDAAHPPRPAHRRADRLLLHRPVLARRPADRGADQVRRAAVVPARRHCPTRWCPTSWSCWTACGARACRPTRRFGF